MLLSKFKFFNLATDIRVRGFCFGASSNVKATNETNERIAEKTNEANVQMTRETNAANIQMNEANNQLQQKLQDDMNAFNYKMWRENNTYNSPAAQIARGRDAGLNPNSVLGSNSVASSPVQQVSLPETNAGQAVAPHVDPWTAQASRKDIMENMSEFLGQLNSAADMQGKILDNENKSYQNDFAPAMLSAGLQGKRIQNELGKSNVKNVNQNTLLMMRQAEGISQSIEKSKQEVRNLQMEWNNLSEDNYRKQVDNAFAFAMNEASLKNIAADAKLKEANVRYLGNKMKCESMLAYAQANNLNWQSNVLKLEAKAREEFLKNGGTIAQIRQMDAAADLYVSNKKGQDLTNGITAQMGKYQIREAAANADVAEYHSGTFYLSLDALDKIGGAVQKVGTGVGSAVNAFKPGVTINHDNGFVSTPTGRNPYE